MAVVVIRNERNVRAKAHLYRVRDAEGFAAAMDRGASLKANCGVFVHNPETVAAKQPDPADRCRTCGPIETWEG